MDEVYQCATLWCRQEVFVRATLAVAGPLTGRAATM
jgi:hypothetical protein